MAKTRRNKGSYEWVVLRESNINYVADRTGKDKSELRALLDAAKIQGHFEIRIPLGDIPFFTREGR